ncbi:MAG: hypothetical protein L6R19_22075 [Alphaproteobacteria bacterium]|nr:hypothetical protein [Alphaproteobacteria bacterium]
MSRQFLSAALIAAALAAGMVGAQAAEEPLFDDQAYHPQLLPRGSLEYEYATRRKAAAQLPKPSADPQQVGRAMTACDKIHGLSAATREKCEIRARQSAVGAAPGATPSKHVKAN